MKNCKNGVDKAEKKCYYNIAVRNGNASKQSAFGTACGPVAQLDRVFDYESKGRGFESRRAHHRGIAVRLCLFAYCNGVLPLHSFAACVDAGR